MSSVALRQGQKDRAEDCVVSDHFELYKICLKNSRAIQAVFTASLAV